MNQTTTNFEGFEAILTAHKDEKGGLLLVELRAEAPEDAPPRLPLKVAIVIDRSGSMSGEKIEITKRAVAAFLRSLGPEDQVAVVAYDDDVDLICPLGAPSEKLARKVEKLQPGGWTNLYGGWVAGAKLVGGGGRVILLSDGQANAGRVTDAVGLSAHSRTSYQRYGVTTTTVGVGRDYDEGLMAGMAREGGGSHYFAHEASAIMDAFSQERFSADSILLAGVSVRCGPETLQFGHFWGGEAKRRVFRMDRLAGAEATVRYTNRQAGLTKTEPLEMPRDFGYSEDARLEELLQTAAATESEMLSVRDPRSAGAMKERLRSVVLELLAHPSCDEPAVAAVIDRLKASIDRLEALERHYVEDDAMMHRKRSMQSSHNILDPAKAFTSFDDERAQVRSQAMAGLFTRADDFTEVDPGALRLAPLESWIAWEALPIQMQRRHIVVAMVDHRSGFVVAEIEKATGHRVRAVPTSLDRSQIVEKLREAAAS